VVGREPSQEAWEGLAGDCKDLHMRVGDEDAQIASKTACNLPIYAASPFCISYHVFNQSSFTIVECQFR
jgi:hypothetical protein